MKHNKNTQGFTLVELAIVLVIIGLIVSSVLVGQDLIRAAELRAVVSQYEKFQTAVNTFQGKYSGVPGDIQGESYGLTDTVHTGSGDGDGDSDGLLESAAGANDIAQLDGEIVDFWAHLTTAGKEMIPGSYSGAASGVMGVTFPEMKYGGTGWSVFGLSADAKNYFIAGVQAASTPAISHDTVDTFIPIDAFNIDNKIDDGLPLSGTIVPRDGAADDPDDTPTSGTGTVECIDTAPTPDSYNFDAPAAACTLRFEMATF